MHDVCPLFWYEQCVVTKRKQKDGRTIKRLHNAFDSTQLVGNFVTSIIFLKSETRIKPARGASQLWASCEHSFVDSGSI
jgi:hypothetical protein